MVVDVFLKLEECIGDHHNVKKFFWLWFGSFKVILHFLILIFEETMMINNNFHWFFKNFANLNKFFDSTRITWKNFITQILLFHIYQYKNPSVINMTFFYWKFQKIFIPPKNYFIPQTHCVFWLRKSIFLYAEFLFFSISH